MDYLFGLMARLAPSEPSTGTIGSIELNIWLPQIMGVPLVGLKPESMSLKAGFVVYGLVMHLIFNFIYFGFEMYDLMLSLKNLDALVQNICISFMHLCLLVKTFNSFYRHSEMRCFIEKLKFAVKTFVVSKPQRAVFFRGEFEIKLLFVIYGLVISNSLLIGIILLWNDPENHAGKIFPFHVVLPSWMPFALQLAYMSSSVVIYGLQVIGVDYFNINFINQLRFQLQILNISFEDLTMYPQRDENFDDISENDRLKSIIEHHCLLMELHADVEKIFRFPSLVQFCTSLIIFAFAGFMITIGGGNLFIYLYLICTLMQLFLYCWFGNEVFEQSQTLATSGYNCNWYQFDQRFKSSLLIFLRAAQRPFQFTAGGIISLSLPTFTSIISKSYTYIAVLQQMYGQDVPLPSEEAGDVNI